MATLKTKKNIPNTVQKVTAEITAEENSNQHTTNISNKAGNCSKDAHCNSESHNVYGDSRYMIAFSYIAIILLYCSYIFNSNIIIAVATIAICSFRKGCCHSNAHFAVILSLALITACLQWLGHYVMYNGTIVLIERILIYTVIIISTKGLMYTYKSSSTCK